ncbi:MAG: DUF2180 family protein [Methanomicrobiales archaeon]|jgi:hypothetical protein|nr:DUF2180 family protein [Methanomicrobiales archaeon]
MKCYICDIEGAEHEAVAVCQICGMGLCREHAIRENIQIPHVILGQTVKTSIPVFLCPDCKNALRNP